MSTAPTRPGTSSKASAIAVVPCPRVDPVLWTWLMAAAERYRNESGDPSEPGYNLERVREHWRVGGHMMMLWLAADQEGCVRGYAVTEVVRGHAGFEAYIPEAYLDPAARCRGVVRYAMATFEAWARSHRCVTIKFSTFRSPAAYTRLLRASGWHEAEVAFAKTLELSHG